MPLKEAELEEGDRKTCERIGWGKRGKGMGGVTAGWGVKEEHVG